MAFTLWVKSSESQSWNSGLRMELWSWMSLRDKDNKVASGGGAGDMAQRLRALATLQGTWVRFSAPTWWLTAFYNSSFGGLIPSGFHSHQARVMY